MAWISLPNEVVLNVTGRPLRTPKVDADLETVYKPIRCPAVGCGHTSTGLADMRSHVQIQHDRETQQKAFALEPELVDATTAHLIMSLVTGLNGRDQNNPLALIRKTNDGMHATECWRRAFNAMMDSRPEIKLKKETYDFIHSLLNRKLPFTKEARERGEEPQDVGMYIYGLAEDTVRQALTILSERRKEDLSEAVEASR